MSIIGYSVVEHHDDGSTKVINKVSADKMAALLSELGGGQRPSRSNYINADACPEHGPWSVQPGGVSQRTGKSYGAFWKCDGKDASGEYCQNRPTKAWAETHPAGRNDASQVAPEPSGTPAMSASDFDDLPF